MPRQARIVLPGVAHHVTQRGNNRQRVFFEAGDFRVYLQFLHQKGAAHGLRVEGFCLIPNHIHIVATPETESALAKTVGGTHQVYAQYLNDKCGQSGHVWQSRYYSCPMDELHALNALAYVELNPVRAGLVKAPWDYVWSSARLHCGFMKCAGSGLVNPTGQFAAPEEWKETLRSIYGDENAQQAIRAATLSGYPLGSAAFLKDIEKRIGCPVRGPMGKGFRRL